MPTDIVTSKEIGAAIRKRRKELGLSQEQLAEKAGVSYQQIQRYENGSSMLNVENVQRIAKILQMAVTSIFTPIPPHAVADPSPPYVSSDEKALLKNFRDLSSQSDRRLAITLIRKMAKK